MGQLTSRNRAEACGGAVPAGWTSRSLENIKTPGISSGGMIVVPGPGVPALGFGLEKGKNLSASASARLRDQYNSVPKQKKPKNGLPGRAMPGVVYLGGKPQLVDRTSGEVLGEVMRQTVRGPEGRARKVRIFAAEDREVINQTKKKLILRNGFADRKARRDQIEARMRDVQGLLIAAGHMPVDRVGWRALRDLGAGELVKDEVAKLRQEWEWLNITWAEVGRCCTKAHGRHVRIQKTSGGSHHLGGLVHCDRSICHIDAGAAAAARRQKLLDVLDQIPADAQLVLKVYTNRHTKGSRLLTIEGQQRKALRGLFGLAKARKATYGRVVTLEITYGENGHHPHRNCLEAYRPGVNLETQREWEEEEYRQRIVDAGGSADLKLQEGWWVVVERKMLIAVVNYICKDDGTRAVVDGEEEVDLLSERVSFEITHGHNKRGKSTRPITDLSVPAGAYAEAWCAKGLTWWSPSGCFVAPKEKTPEPPKTPQEIEEEARLERERQGITVAWLSAERYRHMSQSDRDDLAALVYGVFEPDRFLAFFASRGVLGGFGLGPPPEPVTGDDGEVQDDSP